MDDRITMNENGTLYLDFTEQEQPEQVLEIEASHGLLYYLLLAVIGLIVIFGIIAIAFFGLLLLFLIARYFFWRSSER